MPNKVLVMMAPVPVIKLYDFLSNSEFTMFCGKVFLCDSVKILMKWISVHFTMSHVVSRGAYNPDVSAKGKVTFNGKEVAWTIYS